MAKTKAKAKSRAAKGTHLTKLDESLRTVDGEPILRPRETVNGGPIRKLDKDGKPTDELDATPYELTRRKAILLATALELVGRELDAVEKLRQGRFQRIFRAARTVNLSDEDLASVKAYLNNRWGGVIYSIMCEYLEGGADS